MRRLALLLLALAICLAPALADQSDGIEFRSEGLYDGDHYYGSDYYARNYNSYPVYLSVRVVGTNIHDGLIASYTPVYLEANGEAYVGRVQQADQSVEANWSLQYQVSEAVNQ